MHKFYPLSLILYLSSVPVLLLAQSRDPMASRSPAALPQAESGSVTVDHDVVYASIKGGDLHLDVYEPSADRGTASRPAVMLIHGGGWSSFDKSTMRGMGEFLARHGFVAFSVDYRLFTGKENLWPAQLDDAQTSVRWVRAHAGKYNINPDRLGAFGHSAGAQLAALLGMEDTRENSDPALAKYSSRVQAVVDVSGPTDFTIPDGPEGEAFMASFLGVAYAKNQEVWRDASPVFHVGKKNAAFLIVHGTQDESVPLAHAQELFDKMHAAGETAKLLKMNDKHTFETPEGRRRLAIETLQFFSEYVAGPQ